jgi:hypothetical protein
VHFLLKNNQKRLARLAEIWIALLFSHSRCFGWKGIQDWENALIEAFPVIMGADTRNTLARTMNETLLEKLADPRCQAGLVGVASDSRHLLPLTAVPDIKSFSPGLVLAGIRSPYLFSHQPFAADFLEALGNALQASPTATLLLDLRWDDHDLDWVDPAILEALHPARSTGDRKCSLAAMDGEMQGGQPFPVAWRRVHRGWNEDFNPYVYDQGWESVFLQPRGTATSLTGDTDRPILLLVNRPSIALLGNSLLAWKSSPRHRLAFENSGRFAPQRHERLLLDDDVAVNIPEFHVHGLIDAIVTDEPNGDPEAWVQTVVQSHSLPSGAPGSSPPGLFSVGSRPFPHLARKPQNPHEQITPGECFAILVKLWGVLRHFSPAFRRTSGNDQTWLLSRLARLDATESMTRSALETILRETAAAMPDNHARAVFPQEMSGSLPLQFMFCENRLIIRDIVRDPDGDSILAAGDVVEHVDEPIIPANGASTPQFRRQCRCEELSHPPLNQQVQIRVSRAGKTFEAALTAAEDLPPATSSPHRPDVFSLFAPPWASALELVSERVALFRPFLLVREEWLKEAFTVIHERADSLILDLRDYPRRHAHVALTEYLTTGPISFPEYDRPVVVGSGRLGSRFEHHANLIPADRRSPGSGPAFSGPVVALIDERTISAAEFTGLLIRRNRQVLFIGRPSAGNCGNAAFIRLHGERTFSFTGMDVYDHEGKLFEGQGLTPDILVEPTIQGIREGRDEMLERAISELRAKVPGARQ